MIKRDEALDDTINDALEVRDVRVYGHALVAWALDRVAMGLGDVADAIREHTRAVASPRDE